MNRPLDQSRGYLGYLLDFLISLNVALIAKWQDGSRPVNPLTGLLGFHELEIKSAVNAFFKVHPHSNVGGYIAFLAVALLWTLFIFVVLRLASFSRLIKTVLRPVGGFISLAAIPGAWLLLPPVSRLGLPNPPHGLLTLELLVVVVIASLFVWRNWLVPSWLIVGLLVLHFVLWGWLLMGGPYFWLDPFYLIFPATGLASCLMCGLFYSKESAVGVV